MGDLLGLLNFTELWFPHMTNEKRKKKKNPRRHFVDMINIYNQLILHKEDYN